MYKSNTHKAIAQTKKNKTMRKKKIRGGLGSKELIVLIFVFLYITSLTVAVPQPYKPDKSLSIEQHWTDTDSSIYTNFKSVIDLAKQVGLPITAAFFGEKEINLGGNYFIS
jgi:cell division protein FtsL